MFADVMLPRSLIAPSLFAILGNKKGPATNGGALSLGSIRSGRKEWRLLSTPDDFESCDPGILLCFQVAPRSAPDIDDKTIRRHGVPRPIRSMLETPR